MKPKPSGGKKKSLGGYQAAGERQLINAYARKVAGNSRDATSKKRVADAAFKKFGASLRAEDVSGKGRSAAAGRRQADLKKYVSAVGAAGVASGYGTVGKKKSSVKPSAMKKASKSIKKI